MCCLTNSSFAAPIGCRVIRAPEIMQNGDIMMPRATVQGLYALTSYDVSARAWAGAYTSVWSVPLHVRTRKQPHQSL